MQSLAGLSCAGLLFAGSTAHAQQTLTWDVNGATPGVGGSGAWNETSGFWFNGATYQAWNNAALDNAVFGGTAGNITVGTPITVHDMVFNVGGYLFTTAGTITFAGVNPTITTNFGTTQLFPALGGSTGVTKNGAGTLQLGGVSAGYTGVTTLNEGTLVLSSSLALGFSTAASRLVLNNGTTLSISAPPVAYNYTLTGGTVNVVLNSSTWSGAPTLTAPTALILSGSNTAGTLSGNLADTGANILSLTRNGAGRVTLSGNNSYSGATTVTRGELQLGSAGALSAGSNLVFNGATATGGAIVLTSSSGDFTRGLGIGAGQLQWLGDGGFRSSGSGRVVNIGGAGATLLWGSDGFVPTGNRLLLGTSSNNLLDFQNGIDLTGGVRAVQGDGGLLTGHARISGVLSGTGGLAQVGSGFLELTGVNTYSGGTNLASGIVVVSTDANLGAVSGALNFTGGTLLNTGAFTTGRAMTLGVAGGTLQTNANLIASGPVDGAGHLTKTGVGMLTLTGANTFAGGTTISTGTLQLGDGGTSGGIIGDVANAGALLLNRSNALTLAGAISGAGTLNQVGAGVTTLTGANTYTGGTTISAGTLQLGDGGVTGSVIGNIVNNGALSFNRSDALTFAGVISGGGLINQVGTGSTTLTGDSATFSGDVAISNGALIVNGALGGAGSTVTVMNGATLAGSGDIGGSVIMDDAVLAPGAGGIGTLTIAGDLSLAALTTLKYQLGEADVVGGSHNDLTIVGGDLVLDGTLNVTQSAGVFFGPGIYRVISYGGTLIDNGLELGATPVGSVDYVQTSVAQQINLVNAQGLTLNYWDGDAGPRNNGVIDGGTGVWSAGNDNWTEASGAINAPYTDAAFAIFAGAPGTVTVDASLGVISVSGMQFATDGYRIEGDAINLAPGMNAIRVGDGTSEGAGYVATISSILTGAGGLDATDLGTLMLTGDNAYAGGTTISAGTLQLGDGGTNGSIVGNVSNESVLAFNRLDDVIFAGVISGSGALDQLGGGMLTLTSDNSYTGGTTISAGTLQLGSGGTSGSIVGDIANDSFLLLNRADALTLAGDISGSGALTQGGAGVSTLTGSNTYTGGTTINAGTLQIGDGGATGSIIGDVANESVLAFNRAGELTMAGAIAGAGSLVQDGSGATILTGANSYTGGTTINAGTLQIGDGGVTGSIVGDVANDGVLAFDRGDDIIFAGVLTGSGAFEQRGDGALTLTANSSGFAGHTSVLDGTLIVDNMLGGTLSVLSGGRVAGVGTVGSTDVASGATLAAGSPYGTLTIAGDVSFAEGSTYEVNLDLEGASTLLHVLGFATIEGGTVSVAGGAYRIGERYTILSADAGLAGQFSDLNNLLPLLDVRLAYDQNNVYLDIERVSATFCTFAVTPNQCAASSAFNTLDADNPVYVAALSSPDLISAQRALDALSGEIYASARTMRLENSRVLSDAILDRSARGFDANAGRGVNFWAQALGASGRQREDGNAAAAESSNAGVVVGADAPLNDNVRLGVAAGYGVSNYDVDARGSATASDDYHLALYGGAKFGALGFRFGAAQSWHNVSAERNVQFLGFADEVTADFGAQTSQMYGEAGYSLSFGALEIEPFARVAYVRASTDDLSEGDSPAALSVAGEDDEVVFTTLGVRAARRLLVSDWNVTVRGALGWRQASGDLAPVSTNAIADSSSFPIAGLAIADEALVFDVGFDATVAANLTFSFAYNRQSSDESSSDAVRANLTLRF